MTASLYVYDLTTAANDVAEFSIDAVCSRILDRRTDASLTIWSVVATSAQAVTFRGLPGIISARLRGTMRREGDELVFPERTTGETLSMSTEALNW